MLRALVSACVNRHGVIAVLVVLALVLGSWSLSEAPLDVFPEFVPAQVDIQTEAPGFAPQQVEELVTKPVENVVNGTAGLATIRSESIPGLSMITVTFIDNIDVHVARQGIAERLAELSGSLPAGVGTPKLSPLVSSTMDLLKIGLVSERADAYTLRDLSDWLIKPRLLAVPGVAHVIPFGGDVRQIQIQPDTTRLASYALTVADIAEAAKAALPLRGAGFIDTPAQRIVLRSPTPEPDVSVLQRAVIAVRNDTPILLRDVAEIKIAPALRYGDAQIMGKRGVMLSVASQSGANTLTTTRAVEAALAELEPALQKQGVTVYKELHRPANFIERALRNLRQSLLIAAVLILGVLYLFLRDFRAALVAFIAIPLSLLAAVAVLTHMGQTLNTMTLGGFAVALGVLVDDGIIDIENILRRLRGVSAATYRQRLDIVLGASLEVRGPVIYATVIAIAVFVPVLFTSNVQGRFIGPLALAFILAVLASLLVAMTATPALSALLLTQRAARPAPAWLDPLKQYQRAAVCFVGRHLRWTLAGLMLLVVGALSVLPSLGGTFMPDFREGHFVMQVTSSVPGTSMEEMVSVGQRITRDVLALPYVQSIEQQVGRAELSEDTFPPHRSEFHIELKPDATIDQAEAQQQLRDILAAYPGLQSEVVTFLGDRISESLSGLSAQVAIKVFGDDLDALDRSGVQIAGALTHIKGIADLQFRRQSGTPIIAIHVLPDALAAAGLKAQEVLDTIETAYAGVKVGQTFAGTRTVDVVALLPDAVRHEPAKLKDLLISSPGGPVPLSQLARIEVTQDRYTIQHDGGQRLVVVSFNVNNGNLQAVVDEAKHLVASTVALPPGSFVQFTGAAEAALKTRHELSLYAAIALAVILVIFFASFRWRANSWLALSNLPFSLIGSILLIYVLGLGLSLGTVVGLVTVFGISSRNGILQLAHYEHLVQVEGLAWNRDLMLRGANERLVPILMTAVVTALGLAPLAFGLKQPGQEIEGPMAVTVLGGLFSSTLLNLLVLPALTWRYAAPRQSDLEPEA